MEYKKVNPFFKVCKRILTFLYGKWEIIGLENVPERNAVIVGNHAQIHGPLAGELILPSNYFIWCTAEMLAYKEVPAYAYQDFWSQKPKWQRPFFKLASYCIAPVAVFILGNARTIPVYRDMRLIRTMQATTEWLEKGCSILIFPEKDALCNNIVYEFEENFVDTARFFYRKTKEAVSFVPVYFAPAMKKIVFGKPVAYDPQNAPAAERKRIVAAMAEAITDIGRGLPTHKVVPYRNIPKKNYLTNKQISEVPK